MVSGPITKRSGLGNLRKCLQDNGWELKGKQTVVRGLLSGDRPPVTGFIGILQMKHTSPP